MYTITSDAGLDARFDDPIDVYDILYNHLAEHVPHRKVSWTITTPDQPLHGNMTLGDHPDDLPWVADTVREITTGLLWIHHLAKSAGDGR